MDDRPAVPRESSLRAWRKRAGLSLEMVAATAQVSRQTVENWEYGRGTPRTEQVARLVPLAPGLLDALGLGAS